MKLSQGIWHRQVSRNLDENLRQRAAILKAADRVASLRSQLREMCKNDILFYINLFVWQFNPSKRGAAAIHPFITFPMQERALIATPETHALYKPYDRGILWCFENDKTMACEKSRWQGASWLFLIFQDWLCLFHEYIQTLNISRNEDAVDDGSKDSLFWKLDYMHDRLPDWLKGGEIEHTKLYFHYHLTDSEATGQASTAKAGVGGRASIIFVDEYPEIDRGQEIREKTALTTNSRFFNGTHLGVGTPFQVMCDPRKSPEIVRWRFHWTDHPEQAAGLYEYNPSNPNVPIIHDKTFAFPADYPFVLDGSPTGGPRPGVRSPWYDKKCLEMGDSRAVAQNLDIAPEGAAKQFFDGLKIRSIINEVARPPVWVGDVRHDRTGRLDPHNPLHRCETGRLRLWVMPKGDNRLPASRYTLGVDISAGTGATPSCAAGIDADRSYKVLEYSNPFIVESEFASVVVALCQLLTDAGGNGAYVCWDSSGQQGTKFERSIIDLGYRNIYYNDEEVLRFGNTQPSRRPGWYGSNAQKYAVLTAYRQAIYDGLLVDLSEDCLLETLLFEYDRKTNTVKHAGEIRNNDPSGARENHGDMVIASSLGWLLASPMAEGGKRSRTASAGPQPNTLEWLLLLDSERRRREEWY